MVKEIGTTLQQYMDNVPIESENPFYINKYNSTEGNNYWSNNGNRFRVQEGYGFTYANDDPDYFVIAVKAGWRVQIAIESNALTRWNGMEPLPSGFEIERIGFGGNAFLRFTMTAGGFIEISGGQIGGQFANDYSTLENQLDADAVKRDLQNNHSETRVRFSAGYDKNVDDLILYSWNSISGNKQITTPKLYVILDGVEKIPEEEEGGVPEQQIELVPEGETAVTKDDIGTWELIHDEYGHKWEIVELKSPTESETWAFYFDGVLISAFADKNDALISLNFHYEKTVSRIKSEAPAEVKAFSNGETALFGIAGIIVTRILGGLL